MNKISLKKSTITMIVTTIILAGLAGWFCYPILPWEDTYGEYLLGDMKQLYNSPLKTQFEENQDITKFGANNGNYRYVYLFANGNDIYYITESSKEMGKELYNLKGEAVAKLYDGSYNTLCGVKVIDNRLYYVYGNIHARQAVGSFVKDAATVEVDGKKQLLSTVVVFKPNFAVYDPTADKVTKISKKDYIEAVNKNKTEGQKESSGEGSITGLINQSKHFMGAPEELYIGETSQGSFSDQGVTVKYLASFSDGEAIYLFFDITDTGAGLFSKDSNGHDFSLDEYDFSEKAGYTDSKTYDVVSFNKKTRTATLLVEYIGLLQNDYISFHIYSMNGNQKTINCTLDDIDLYGQLKKTKGEFEQEEQYMGKATAFGVMDEKTGESKNVELPEFNEDSGDSIYRLKTDVLALPVENEEGSHVADLTNIGWRNGWLHVQVNPEDNIKWETNFNLKNKKTGELLYSPYNISFGPTGGGNEKDDYSEYMFYVGDITKDNLDYSIVFNKSPYRATDLKGDWVIKFAIPDSLVKKLETGKAVPVRGHELLIQRAVVSPVNITLFASRKDVPEALIDWFYNLYADDLKLKLVYKNGKTADIPQQSGATHGNQKGDMFRFMYTAENYDDITGLEVNGVLLPVAE